MTTERIIFMKIKIKYLTDIEPIGRINVGDWIDLRCAEDIDLKQGEFKLIPLGIAMEIPEGFAGLIYARSGLACKRGLAPANKVGVIDSDYRGEFIVVLHNHGDEMQIIQHGERIAQLLITPIVTPSFQAVQSLSDTERSSGGFGSTGK